MSSDIKTRLGGLLILAIGGAAAWWGIWRPLHQAYAGATQINYSLKALVIAPFALIFGAFLLLAGDRVSYRDAERQPLTPIGWALMAVCAIAAAGTYFWVEHLFSSLGYRSR